jgi:hypothetical protein
MNLQGSRSNLILAAALLGIFSLATYLAAHHVADGDLWAKLALGASVWLRGELFRHDVFAFTPVLPKYIDHEWGSGVIFFGALRFAGSGGLMLLKTFLCLGAVAWPLLAARRNGNKWPVLLLLAIPCALCILPGYIPTVRSHAFTYFFFGAILWCLEEIKRGHERAAWCLPVLFLLWANLHGGFVAGLGTLAVYVAEALLLRRQIKMFLIIAVCSAAVTLINPYGLDFWRYLVPALLHPRPRILEWQPLSLFGFDPFLGFRILFVGVLAVVILEWRRAEKKSWSGLVMLAITAFLGWRSRRHAPFFGVAALVFAAPYFEMTLARVRNALPLLRRSDPATAVLAAYLIASGFVATRFLANASWQVLAPVGHDPVREADILARANVSGNLAVPFGWGSYAAWRLFPKIKISHDGRYEAAYPESTFELNNAFFEKHPQDWDRLIREYRVDFVILDLQHEQLRPEDLRDRGYDLIWMHKGISALLARSDVTRELKKAAADLPPTTIDPLDANIPRRWWQSP